MKIESSAVSMSAKRDYNYFEQRSAASLTLRSDEAALLDFSKEGVSLMEQMREEQTKIEVAEKEKEKQREKNMLDNFEEHMKRIREANENAQVHGDEMDWKIKLMRKMLELLNGRCDSEEYKAELNEMKAELRQSGSFEVKGGSAAVSTGAIRPNTWTKTTVESAFVSEFEMTAFETTGIAKTADGREISFGVTLEMSRAFQAQYESLTKETYVVTDPLVINLDTNVASLSDQKFLFDLNTDGKEDEISYLGKGSGFLAVDKNKDGIVNDGSELFGTKSGDGFKDLGIFDEDGNGWIDENDSIYEDLRVWMKSEDGTDILINLKEADVGAIYLGSASTEFSLKNDTNATNGIIKQTGVYLKESGGVSTVQHVDFVV